MRTLVAHMVLVFCALGAVGQQAAKLQISEIPIGRLSGSIYTNDALGVTYEFPSGWQADIDPKNATIDWRGPNRVANRCSKILLWLSPASKRKGRFNPVAILFAIDPRCLGAPPFPSSVDDTKEIIKVAEKVGKTFNYTPFMSPYGNAVTKSTLQGRVVVEATGSLIVNDLENPAKTKEPVEVKTSFAWTEVNDYWVVWAYAADEAAAETLTNAVKVSFK